jgi:mono/diheme cytochrome c family protein
LLLVRWLLYALAMEWSAEVSRMRAAVFVGLGFLLGCSQLTDTDDKLGGASGAVTFHRDVRPLLEQHCAGCHAAGGIGPFALGFDASEWADGPPSWTALAVSAVKERRMPPWMPDPSCHDMVRSRRLSDDDVAVFEGWAESKYALGAEKDYVAPEVEELALGTPTLEVAPTESYTPNTERPDDYRCFLLPQTFAEESYLTATNVTPGVVHEVHHVILYTIEAGQVAEAEALDAAEQGIGYTCFGGPGLGGAQNIGGWVPGMVPSVAPAESARVIAAGARIVMQVHYNTSHKDQQGVHADRTTAQLWLMSAGQKPKYRINTFPLANLDIRIEAGDASSVQKRTFSSPVKGTLVGVLPHMHTRGTSIEVKHTRGDVDTCLVRVPEWDFHWQQGYRYTEESYVEIERGDQLELTCVYDNSDNDQVVTWGEGTDDEMCLNYLEVRTLLEGNTLAEQCPEYPGCLDGCADGDVVCVIGCTQASSGCQSCTGGALGRCAIGRCQDEGLAIQACLGMCAGDAACARMNCALQSLAFFGCMEPHLRDGSCDDALATCGS